MRIHDPFALVSRPAVFLALFSLVGPGTLAGPSSAAATVQQQAMGKFVFVEGDGAAQDFDIFIVDEDGTDLVDLSHNDGWDTAPEFSNDGHEILFTSDRDGDRNSPPLERRFELYVMNADGSDVRRLTDNPAWDGNAAWSPNGRMITWGRCRSGGKCDVYVMNADGSDKTNLTNSDDHYDGAPTWSPDSRQILFSSDRDRDADLPPLERGRDLYVMDSDGGNVRRLTTTGINTFSDWSPNGQKIVYQGGESGNEVWTMNADGTGQQKLRAGTTPIWSPNGREIAFGWKKVGYLMAPDGSSVRKLTLASGESYDPSDWAAPRTR